MRVLRAVNRRGWSTGTAGWFTIAAPKRWFPASRMRDNFHPHRLTISECDEASSRDTAMAPVFESASQRPDRYWIRLAVIVAAAAVMTYVALLSLAAMGTWYN